MIKALKLSPLGQRRWDRFKANRRGMVALILLSLITLVALCSEIFFNNKALLVKYEGDYYFPVLGKVQQSKDFGLEQAGAVDYHQLDQHFKNKTPDNYVIMPFIPYGAEDTTTVDSTKTKEQIENIKQQYELKITTFQSQGQSELDLSKLRLEMIAKLKQEEKKLNHPLPPDFGKRHLLGTDPRGRDILAQLFYAYRIVIGFAFILLIFSYSIGLSIGCLMGYLGGKFGILFQRIIEIINNIPILYVIMIIAVAVMESPSTNGEANQLGFWHLVGIMLMFTWTSQTWYVRSYTYREKSRDYILAARALGASHSRIIFHHLMPNMVSLIVTFIPFTISAAIVTLTSLDFLGYGLPKGTPSWGVLIQQGTEYKESAWIISSVVIAMTVVIYLINSIGEAIREAFDPKEISHYE